MIVWEINPKNFGAIAKKAVLALQKGKVLACPTDTVYGLIADATNKKAVKRVLLIKGREKGKPLPIFVSSIAMAKRLAKVSSSQEKFLKRVWPGKVTVVLENKNKLPKELGTAKSIGLRIPKYEFLNLLLNAYGKPLTGTSANISGKPPCSSAAEVFAQFQRRKYQPELILEKGKLSRSKPSKIIDVTSSKHKVIRR